MFIKRSLRSAFGLTDEYTNRAIWRGYNSIQQEGGWVSLVFASMGIYRFCKYRQDFTPQNMATLKRMRPRFEVAADTIHPEWRQLLSIIGEETSCMYLGCKFSLSLVR
jgi:hypothetical protein